MRELKFRAFDTKEKKWLYGYDYPNLGGFSLKGECILLGEFGSDLPLVRFLEDVEIMQFTGLKDKNGKEIYEGDILSHLHDGIFHVVYVSELAMFKRRFYDGTCLEFMRSTAPMFCEIIGNIYENTELLK